MSYPPRRYPSAIDRLLVMCFEDELGCWVHRSPTCSGYTRLRVGGGDSRKVFGHRLSYEHFIGPIPADMSYDHLCKNTACVNPWHGEIVTPRENSLRSGGTGALNREKTHCPQGHPLSGDNLRFASGGKGRVCKTCRAASNRLYRSRMELTA